MFELLSEIQRAVFGFGVVESGCDRWFENGVCIRTREWSMSCNLNPIPDPSSRTALVFSKVLFNKNLETECSTTVVFCNL